MSLTQWFREYLYFPLSRSLLMKTGRRYPRLVQTTANLATMGLIGLWHGAAWTYIAWGLWHGMLLSLENISGLKPAARWKQVAMGVVTFHLVAVGWVLFRAESFQAAGRFLSGLLAFQQMAWLPYYLPSILLAGGLCFAIDWVSSGSLNIPARLRQAGQPVLTVAALVILVNLILLALAHGVTARPFIYGQF
jgi:alginate O-acetyltransferase complex protein AlgI